MFLVFYIPILAVITTGRIARESTNKSRSQGAPLYINPYGCVRYNRLRRPAVRLYRDILSKGLVSDRLDK